MVSNSFFSRAVLVSMVDCYQWLMTHTPNYSYNMLCVMCNGLKAGVPFLICISTPGMPSFAPDVLSSDPGRDGFPLNQGYYHLHQICSILEAACLHTDAGIPNSDIIFMRVFRCPNPPPLAFSSKQSHHPELQGWSLLTLNMSNACLHVMDGL